MEQSVKITSFEAENVKRVKAVELKPTENGLTIIGGRNGQGKTSVLDAIAWALGGNRFKPSNAKREGSATDPHLRVELSNGIVVERKGVNSSLKVTDPEGHKSGQNLLDSFLEQLALNLPNFLNATDKEKAETLLQILGIGDELTTLEAQEQQLYNQRTTMGQLARQKRGAAEDMMCYPDAPSEPIGAAELIKEQQEILARNGENQRKRQQAAQLDSKCKDLAAQLARFMQQAEDINQKINEVTVQLEHARADLNTANKTASQLQDESTAEIEAKLQEIDAINAKVRTNAARENAMVEADELEANYKELTEQINDVRSKRMALLEGANLPLPGLGVENGLLTYNGQVWDCMSGSEQLRVATAIVRALKPSCGFVLVDKLEQFDPQTLAEFGAWAEGENLQIIGTRVGSDDSCQIVIEDGYSKPVDPTPTLYPAGDIASAPTLAPAVGGPFPSVNPADRFSELTANTTAPAIPNKKWSL